MKTPGFSESLGAWPSGAFKKTLKRQLEGLDPGVLPLTSALNQGGLIDDRDISFSIISAEETAGTISAKVGVFFKEIVGGCNCSEDPVAHNVYCELIIDICKETANAGFRVTD